MYIVSKTQLLKDAKLEAVFENKTGERATAVKFVYPAYYLKNKTQHAENLTDKDNPIGTILPFAGDSTKIPQGWRICNGDYLKTNGNESLFNVIGYKWGKNDNNDFRLPDLQGQFLRGVDYSKKIDPDVNDRKNSIGEVGEVGSYQLDAFQGHGHTNASFQSIKYKNSNGYSGGGHSGTVEMDAGTVDKGYGEPRVSNETRPTNAYVNFIIRVK